MPLVGENSVPELPLFSAPKYDIYTVHLFLECMYMSKINHFGTHNLSFKKKFFMEKLSHVHNGMDGKRPTNFSPIYKASSLFCTHVTTDIQMQNVNYF